jgi:hypothetical protein
VPVGWQSPPQPLVVVGDCDDRVVVDDDDVDDVRELDVDVLVVGVAVAVAVAVFVWTDVVWTDVVGASVELVAGEPVVPTVPPVGFVLDVVVACPPQPAMATTRDSGATARMSFRSMTCPFSGARHPPVNDPAAPSGQH